MEPLLTAAGLGKAYGSVNALRRFDLEVYPGEVVGLLGPNGAGKTTCLRLLAGILTPSEGHASICGFDTVADPLKVKQRLGFLSGDTALYKRLTPREILAFFGRLHELDEATIRERSIRLIADLDMSAFADRPCGTLSAGQQQKANIARTLLHDPPVLILDEPTTALDIVTGQFILDTVRKARAAGKAVLFSTHIMGEAEYLCDRIVLIHRGEVRAQGTLHELQAQTGLQALADIFLGLIAGEA